MGHHAKIAVKSNAALTNNNGHRNNVDWIISPPDPIMIPKSPRVMRSIVPTLHFMVIGKFSLKSITSPLLHSIYDRRHENQPQEFENAPIKQFHLLENFFQLTYYSLIGHSKKEELPWLRKKRKRKRRRASARFTVTVVQGAV